MYVSVIRRTQLDSILPVISSFCARKHKRVNGENMPVACAVCKRAAILKRPKTVIYGFIVRTDTTGLL